MHGTPWLEYGQTPGVQSYNGYKSYKLLVQVVLQALQSSVQGATSAL